MMGLGKFSAGGRSPRGFTVSEFSIPNKQTNKQTNKSDVRIEEKKTDENC